MAITGRDSDLVETKDGADDVEADVTDEREDAAALVVGMRDEGENCTGDEDEGEIGAKDVTGLGFSVSKSSPDGNVVSAAAVVDCVGEMLSANLFGLA
jgi:hypothetical protein